MRYGPFARAEREAPEVPISTKTLIISAFLAACADPATTPADVCATIGDTVTACETGTAPAPGGDCERMFSDCDDAELDALLAFYQCIVDTCDGASCVAEMNDVGIDCLDADDVVGSPTPT